MISIIMPSYNSASTIRLAIISVLSQTYKNIELIIVDGGSTDETLNIISNCIKNEKYHICKYISEKDLGVYDAMNKGVNLASGDWLFFLGTDDILLPSFSDACNMLINKNMMYYCNTFLNQHCRIYDGKFSKLKLSIRNLSHQTIFYPKIVFDKYTYDLNYKIVADYILNLNCFGNKEIKKQYIPLTISVYNESGLSNTNIDTLFYSNKFCIIRKYLGLWYACNSAIFDYFHFVYKKYNPKIEHLKEC